MWILHFFINNTAEAVLKAHTYLFSSNGVHPEGKQTSYCQVINYLLALYATDGIIAEVNMGIMDFKQLDCQREVEYGQPLRTK